MTSNRKPVATRPLMNRPVDCSPAIIMCAATRWTFQPRHSVSAVHCSGDSDASMSAARVRSSWIICHVVASLKVVPPVSFARERGPSSGRPLTGVDQFATGRNRSETIQEELPPVLVVGDGVLRETTVHQSH